MGKGILLVLCLSLAAGQAAAEASAGETQPGDRPSTVGNLATLSRIIFSGQRTFSDESLRAGLRLSLDFVLAGFRKKRGLAEFSGFTVP